MAELPSGAITFLFTDVEGSTRLLKQLRDRYGEVLAEHQRLLREAFNRHGGRVIDTQGDSFFVVFGSARAAVLAAVDVQRALREHDWPEDAAVRVRIGIHTGQAELSEESYVGLSVHRAARISAAGHGGQILVSQTTHNLLEDEEEDIPGVELRDLGQQRLKDLDRPVRVYQVEAEGFQREFPPLRTAVRSPAAQPQHRRRPVLVGAVACVLAAAVAIPIFALGGGGSGSSPAEGENAVGVIEAASGQVRGTIGVPSAPTAVASGFGYVWVASAEANAVHALDPSTDTVRDTIALEGAPTGIVAGAGYVWVTNSLAGTLSKIDPQSFGVEATIDVGNGPSGVAVGRGHVWVTNTTDHTVSKIRLRDLQRVDYPVGPDPAGIAVGAGGIWIASTSSGRVIKLSPGGTKLREVSVGQGAAAVAIGPDAVWVANGLAGTVSKIDPDTGDEIGTVDVGGNPSGVAVAGGSVWVANQLDGTLSRIDPATNQAKPVRIAGEPTAVASGGGDVYVALRPAGRAHRGGTLRVLSERPSFFTVDPAVGFETELWRFLSLTNDGLVTYRRAAGQAGYELVPDLATAPPVVSQDGKTYTFELRRGIRYSNGGVVDASDVRASLERVFRIWPHGQGAVEQFFGGIRGAQACSRRRCDLSAGIEVDDPARTISFQLTAPDPIFLYKLALPFSSVLPAATPRRVAVGPLPATGPYRIASVVPNRTVRLVRNPRFREWSSAAQPAGFPDEVVVRFVSPAERRIRAVADGRADLTSNNALDPVPVAPALRRQVRRYPIPSTAFFVLNPTRSPFADVRVRQAINYAVDRNKVVELARQDAAPTCQVLPPNFPGFRRYCPYTLDPNADGTWSAPNLAKALRLVTGSGTEGDDVTVWFPPDQGRVGRYIARLLASLHYRVHVSSFKSVEAYFGAMIPASPQLAWSLWQPNYPSAEEFIRPLFTCGSDANFGSFCDRMVDRKIDHALEVQERDQSAATRLWAALDHEITDKAAWLSLYNVYGADLVSARVGNYQYNPQFGALLSQMWVR